MKLFLGIITVLIIILGFFFFIYTNYRQDKIITEEGDERLSLLDNIHLRIDYFNYDYIDRYLDYKEKFPDLEINDIITFVNIGLDRQFYSEIVLSDLENQNNILVNKFVALDSSYVPENLLLIDNQFSKGGIYLVSEALDNFEAMCSDARMSGYNIRAVSAYRSYDYQANLYNEYVRVDGVLTADKYSARPGHSEHQTGLAVDLDNYYSVFTNFHDTDEFLWMMDNAYKYGFILRYPIGSENITGYQYESWHYRYVGVEIATTINDLEITYDEYFYRYINKE